MQRLLQLTLLAGLTPAISTSAAVPTHPDGAGLHAAAFQQVVDDFNRTDRETVVQHIANAAAWDWMRMNVPWFECPDADLQEIYYNHSSFCDLVITGLVGLRPRADDLLEMNPLIPAGTWD